MSISARAFLAVVVALACGQTPSAAAAAVHYFLEPRGEPQLEPLSPRQVQSWFPRSSPDDSMFNFNEAVMTHSNLFGLGPDSGDKSIIYHRVGSYNGEILDLVMRVVGQGGYDGVVDNNILDHDALMGIINMKTNLTTDLELFIRSNVTGLKVVLPRFFFTVFDIDAGSIAGQGDDGAREAGVESNTLGPLYAFYTRKDAHLVISRDPARPDFVKFTAATGGTEADNPADPFSLTDDQARKTVMGEFRNVDHFYMRMAVTDGWGHRNMLFSGVSEMASSMFGPCYASNFWQSGSVKLAQPWNGSAMIFDTVMHLDGLPVDMSVKLVDGFYAPLNVSLNGLEGKMGQINMGTDDLAAFKFAFWVSGTELPVTVPHLFFSFFDIDQEGGVDAYESLTLRSASGTYFVTPTTALRVRANRDGTTTFESSTYGSASNNPTDGDTVDPAQLDDAVTLHFAEPVHSFVITYQSHATYSGRNFQFGGMTPTACS